MDDDSPSTSSSTTAQQQGNDLNTHRVDSQASRHAAFYSVLVKAFTAQ